MLAVHARLRGAGRRWRSIKRSLCVAADQHDAMDYTPFEGMSLTGWPVTVLSRGRRIVEGGELKAERGSGAFISRGLPEIAGRPGYRAPELDPAHNFGAEIAP